MAQIVKRPSLIQAAGTPPKQIEEFFGRVNTRTDEVSIARMVSPSGWKEPGQVAEFTEYTVVLKGVLHVETRESVFDVQAGQGISIPSGQWVRYSTPASQGAEYIAVCLPAFSPEKASRDSSE